MNPTVEYEKMIYWVKIMTETGVLDFYSNRWCFYDPMIDVLFWSEFVKSMKTRLKMFGGKTDLYIIIIIITVSIAKKIPHTPESLQYFFFIYCFDLREQRIFSVCWQSGDHVPTITVLWWRCCILERNRIKSNTKM